MRRFCFAPSLCAGFTLRVDGYGGSRGRGHLHGMILTAEVVGDIPVGRAGLSGYVLATLNVLGGYLLTAACATHVGSHHGTCDSATSGGKVLTAAATDLVS